ncbi:MAG: hypothetical protein LBC96_04085 [Lachnospiraceae bacterium]|jgi:hypothetical protein|nr:hypothetical protein [Lachnospiraceae bacterium]
MTEEIIALDTEEYGRVQMNYDEYVGTLKTVADNFQIDEIKHSDSILLVYKSEAEKLKLLCDSFWKFQMEAVTQLGEVCSGFVSADSAGG